MGDENTDDLASGDEGEGFTEVTLIVSDELLRHILTSQPLSDEQYGELVSALVRATGATGAV